MTVARLRALKGGRADVPPAPASLTADGREVWERVAPALAARGMLTPDRIDLLAAYCSQHGMIRAIDRALATEPLVITGGNGVPRPHPLIGAKNRATQTSTQLAKRLGLFAAASARPAKGGADDDPWA